MGNKYKVTADYRDGCKSWYYFDDERKAKRKAKQLADYDSTKNVSLTINFK